MDIINPQEDNTTNNPLNQDKKLCYIYRHVRLDTNVVFYIGKGTNTDGRYERANTKRRTNQDWHDIVNTHDYVVEIVIENLTEKESNEKEKYYILEYGRIDLGTGTLVNKTSGGQGASGAIRSEEIRDKYRKAQTGKKASEETKKKMRERKRTPEHIEKMAKANRGRIQSEEHRRKNSEANKGHKRGSGKKKSPEHIEKIRQAHIGKTLSVEQVEKMYKPVGQYKNGILIKEYPSCKSTELDGFNRCKVSLCCNGHRKTHGGFQWNFFVDGIILDKIDIPKTISELKNKQVAQYTLDNIFICSYPSIQSTKLDGYNPSCVSLCANGKQKQYKNFIWKFL